MPDAATTRTRPRRRRWVWAVVALIALGVAGPTLVGLTPLPHRLLAGALPSEAGRLTAESTSFAWTGPLRLRGLQLRDAQDAVLFSAESAQIEGGLIGLLAGDNAPLRVRIDRPKIDLVVGPERTNFDAVLAALKQKQAADQPPAGPDGQPTAPGGGRPIEVVVTDGALLVTDATTADSWLLDALQVRFTDPSRGFDAVGCSASGRIAAYANGKANSPAGDLALAVGPSQNGRHAEVRASGIPLAMLRPFLRRADPTADLRGVVEVNGEADWLPTDQPILGTGPADLVRTLAAGNVRSTGLARFTGVELVGRATQGGPVQLATVDLPWRFAGAGDRLTLQQLELTSEVGRAEAAGVISAAEVDRWASGVAAAPRDLRLAARLDFERLSRVAPQFVRLQQGARIDAGRIDLTTLFDAGRIEARLATGQLSGVADGRRVAWREPVEIDFAATQRAPDAGLAGWAVESLKATSSFFHATAEGDAARLSGEADFDLDRLARELAPLVDLGEVRLAGSGRAEFLVNRDTARQAWRLKSRGGVRGLLVGDATAPLANEPRLDFDAQLSGSLSNLQSPPTGTVKLTAGDDNLTATLPQPGAGTDQPFAIELAGDAVRWWRRAAALSADLPPPEAIDLEGRVRLNAEGVADADGGRLDRFTLALNGFGVDTVGLDATTPRVRLRNERIEAGGVAAWRKADRSVQITRGQLVTSVASASMEGVNLSLDAPAESRGRIDYRADLARLASWTPPRDGRPSRYTARGQVSGTALLRGVPGGISVVVKAEGRELALLDRQPTTPNTPAGAGPQTVWSEPRVEIDADLTASPVPTTAGTTAYSLQFRDTRIASESINGSFGGRIDDVGAMSGVAIGGGVDYDLEKLTPILWPTLGDGVRLVGRDRATFRLETDESAPPDAAPLTRLRATVAAPWEGADLFGLPVGAGRLSANLAKGVLRVDPLYVALGGGRLTAEVAATLEPQPATLSLRPGPLVTGVAMSPEVCERVLKFIAPVMADATRIDGRFSVSLTELTVPLGPPPTRGPPPGRAAGVLDIHHVRVMPGPSVAEWVGVVRQIVSLARDGVQAAARPSNSALLTIDDSRVDFQMIDGRVYHRGLKFYVGDALVESSGSVGTVDETLDLVLAVPILDEWIEREPVLLGRLRGQSLRVPVQGTLKKPKVNSNAFRELSGRVLESAAAGAVESGLNKLFEKLRSR